MLWDHGDSVTCYISKYEPTNEYRAVFMFDENGAYASPMLYSINLHTLLRTVHNNVEYRNKYGYNVHFVWGTESGR